MILNGYRKKPNNLERNYNPEDDGKIEHGRSEEEVGAHVKGYNTNSIGICLIGVFTFTLNQFLSLRALLKELKSRYPGAEIVGHCDLDPVNKANCPGFDVDAFLSLI